MPLGVSRRSREARRGERSRALLGVRWCDHDRRRCGGSRRIRSDPGTRQRPCADTNQRSDASDGLACDTTRASRTSRSYAERVNVSARRAEADSRDSRCGSKQTNSGA
jgi:hypothetical protein